MLIPFLFETAAAALPTLAPIPTLSPEASEQIADLIPQVNQSIEQFNEALPGVVAEISDSISTSLPELTETLEHIASGIFHLTVFGVFCVVFWRILMHVIWGLFSRSLARSKGYDGGFWWGFFLGLYGMLFVALKPDKNLTAAVDRLNATVARLSAPAPDAGTGPAAPAPAVCPHCGAVLAEGQKFCSNCGAPKD